MADATHEYDDVLNSVQKDGQMWIDRGETVWCRACSNWVAIKASAERSATGPARSWWSVGMRVAEPKPGSRSSVGSRIGSSGVAPTDCDTSILAWDTRATGVDPCSAKIRMAGSSTTPCCEDGLRGSLRLQPKQSCSVSGGSLEYGERRPTRSQWQSR